MNRIYDVFHVDDDLDFRENYEYVITGQELTYMGVSSLEDLGLALNSGIAGKINLIDGNFLRKNKDMKPKTLYPEAVGMIREKFPDADIILFSHTKLIQEAGKLGIDYLHKMDYTPRELVIELKKRLDQFFR